MESKTKKHLSQNIKFLRKRKKVSQEIFSDAVGVKRTSVSGYEAGTNEPPLKILIAISEYFLIGIDQLIRDDLTNYPELRLQQLELGYGIDLEGKGLRIVATTVGDDNEDNIELVPEKAKAGYSNGFADPEYIKVLSTFRMPFLDRSKKYRSFQISGDSMPPVSEGSWVTGEYLQNWRLLRSGQPYIVVTKNDGIVFKVVYNKLDEKASLLLCSTNPFYKPYEISIKEVCEVWKFVNYISSELSEPNLPKETLTKTVYELQREISEIKTKLKSS